MKQINVPKGNINGITQVIRLYLIFDIFIYKFISKIVEVRTYANKMHLLQEFR